MLGLIYDRFNELRRIAKDYAPIDADSARRRIPTKYCEQGRRECVISQIGSYFWGLTAGGLWPEKDLSEILMSPVDLEKLLKSISMSSNHFGEKVVTSSWEASWGTSWETSYETSCGVLQIHRVINHFHKSSPLRSMSEEQRARLAKQRGLWDFSKK